MTSSDLKVQDIELQFDLEVLFMMLTPLTALSAMKILSPTTRARVSVKAAF